MDIRPIRNDADHATRTNRGNFHRRAFGWIYVR